MKPFFLILLINCILLISSLFTEWTFANDDLTSSGYTIDVGSLSPMGGGTSDTGDGTSTGIVNLLLGKISKLLLFILPLISAISLIIAGYYYILSGGDSEKASRAKTIIKWNVVAIFTALFSYAIIQIVASILGGNI